MTMKQKQPSILIGVPIRNAEVYIQKFLFDLSELLYKKGKIGFYFLLNDSTDNTEEKLLQFQAINEDYRFVEIDYLNFNAPLDKRTPVRLLHTNPHLNILRNKIIDRWRKDDAEYLFMIDADTLLQPDCLQVLLAQKKDAIAPLLAVDFGENRLFQMMNKSQYFSEDGTQVYNRVSKEEIDKKEDCFEVDAIGGGAVLYHRDTINCEFFNHPQDPFIGRSANLTKAGFHLWALKNPQVAIHDMRVT